MFSTHDETFNISINPQDTNKILTVNTLTHEQKCNIFIIHTCDIIKPMRLLSARIIFKFFHQHKTQIRPHFANIHIT